MLSPDGWRNAVLNPIDDQCAVGSSARLGDLFDKLQLEVSHQLALEGSSTNWQKVLKFSHEILAKQSKDLLVLVYSMRAFIDVNRYQGAAEALSVFNGYLKQYWTESFPPIKRKRARVAALEWFAQQFEVWVAYNKPEEYEKHFVESALASIKLINQQLAEYGSDFHLDLSSSARVLKEFISSLSSELNHSGSTQDTARLGGVMKLHEACSGDQPSHAEVVQIGSTSQIASNVNHNAPKPGSPKSPAAESITPQTEITDDKTYSQGIRDTQSILKNLAKYRLTQDLSDPRAYEINRFSVWLPVSELPLHQNNLTPLRSIPAEKRHFLDTLFQQRQYEILVVELENSLSNAPFWLDGHRMVVDSLKAIDRASGSSGIRGHHQNAIDAISELTKSFTTRLNGIERLKFSDDLPFASDETRAWLSNIESNIHTPGENVSEEIGLQRFVDLSPQNQTDEVNGDQKELEVIQQSNKAFKEQGFSKGFLMLDRYCDDQMNKKAWYKARLITIEYCLSAKEFAFAEQLLIELDELAVNHKLDLWEPDIVSNMLSMMLVCKAKLKRKLPTDSYYQRLVRVSATRGYEMKSYVGL